MTEESVPKDRRSGPAALLDEASWHQFSAGCFGWSSALQTLMRHPDAPSDELLFRIYWGTINDKDRMDALLTQARAHDQQIIYLFFGGRAEDGPTEVTIASPYAREDLFMKRCVAFADNDDAPIQLLSATIRAFAGKDNRLSIKSSRTADERPRRQAKARERWEAAALTAANGAFTQQSSAAAREGLSIEDSAPGSASAGRRIRKTVRTARNA